MRLLKADSPELELVEFFGDRIPEYAILSHTWGDDEVLYQDLQIGEYRQKLGYVKIRYICDQARRDDLHWCWVDTCCIDKSSSAELSEAINSMFNWYKRARVCYTYLADVHRSEHRNVEEGKSSQGDLLHVDKDLVGDQHHPRTFPEFRLESAQGEPTDEMPATSECSDSTAHQTVNKAIQDSRWFQRGWTLQELIAPRLLYFYDSSWQYLGDRDNELSDLVCDCTNLDTTILGIPEKLRDIPVARRMSWMAHRRTTRIEDVAYCMLGIFGVSMSLLYGEEDKAFLRLQEEIAKNGEDHSLFVSSNSYRSVSMTRKMLAASPSDFEMCHHLKVCNILEDKFPMEPYHLTSDGLRINLPLLWFEECGNRVELAVLSYQINGSPIGLILHRIPYNKRVDIRYIGGTRGALMNDMVKTLSPGTALVSVPREIALTAKRATVMVRGDEHLRRYPRPPSLNAWVRSAL
jgi:hypothetical protein